MPVSRLIHLEPPSWVRQKGDRERMGEWTQNIIAPFGLFGTVFGTRGPPRASRLVDGSPGGAGGNLRKPKEKRESDGSRVAGRNGRHEGRRSKHRRKKKGWREGGREGGRCGGKGRREEGTGCPDDRRGVYRQHLELPGSGCRKMRLPPQSRTFRSPRGHGLDSSHEGHARARRA